MKKISLQITALLLFFIAAISLATHSFAQSAPSIGGYSPVAYFTENQALKGDPGYTATHEDRLYYFRNAEELAMFNADPEKYVPRFPVCAYSLTLGKRMPIDPTNFQVVEDHLLLFHRSEELDGLALFEESELTDAELLERADREFRLLEF